MISKTITTEDILNAFTWAGTDTIIYQGQRSVRAYFPTRALQLSDLLRAYFLAKGEAVPDTTSFVWKREGSERHFPLRDCSFKGLSFRGDFSNCNFNYYEILDQSQFLEGAVLPPSGRFSERSEKGHKEDWAQNITQQQAKAQRSYSLSQQQVFMTSWGSPLPQSSSSIIMHKENTPPNVQVKRRRSPVAAKIDGRTKKEKQQRLVEKLGLRKLTEFFKPEPKPLPSQSNGMLTQATVESAHSAPLPESHKGYLPR